MSIIDQLLALIAEINPFIDLLNALFVLLGFFGIAI